MTLDGTALPPGGEARQPNDGPIDASAYDADAGSAPAGSTTIEAVVEPTAMIFDLDGILIDTVATRIQAWQRAFAEVGIIADRDHLAMLVGADGRRVVAGVGNRAGHPFGDIEADAIDRRASEIFEGMGTDPEPLPGAVALLTALTWGGFPWAIATSRRGPHVSRSVDALGLPARPAIVDGSQAVRAEPAPDLLLSAVTRLGTPAYSTWSIGATSWDMIAARAAGVAGIGVASGTATGEVLRAAGARAVVDDLHELHEELSRRGLVAGGA